jgi:NAD-dependent dihydropyrimidine dehydrogenase PreA subunit
MFEIMVNITKGKGTEQDLSDLQELGEIIKDTSLCGLGQTAPNPVLSTMKYFNDEYKAHVIDKRCPAGVCQDLLSYHIHPDKCIGCTACSKVCPASSISGEVKKAHGIDQEKCIKCGACFTKCKFKAIEKR